MAFSNKEFETEQDVSALRRVSEMRTKPDRLKRAKAMIAKQKKELERIKV